VGCNPDVESLANLYKVKKCKKKGKENDRRKEGRRKE
jgi:hypothetical protein